MHMDGEANKNSLIMSSDNASDSDFDDYLSPALMERISDMRVTTVGEHDNSGAVAMGEVEKLTQEDILIFLENESIVAAQTCSQEVRSHHVPLLDMVFDTQDAAYGFYNEYALICGFSVKKAARFCGKKTRWHCANSAHVQVQ